MNDTISQRLIGMIDKEVREIFDIILGKLFVRLY